MATGRARRRSPCSQCASAAQRSSAGRPQRADDLCGRGPLGGVQQQRPGQRPELVLPTGRGVPDLREGVDGPQLGVETSRLDQDSSAGRGPCRRPPGRGSPPPTPPRRRRPGRRRAPTPLSPNGSPTRDMGTRTGRRRGLAARGDHAKDSLQVGHGAGQRTHDLQPPLQGASHRGSPTRRWMRQAGPRRSARGRPWDAGRPRPVHCAGQRIEPRSRYRHRRRTSRQRRQQPRHRWTLLVSRGPEGCCVRPNRSLNVSTPKANSGQLVLPTRIAPAERSRLTTAASVEGR